MSGRKRTDNWRRYLPARADDNGMYVVACNACGDNGKKIVFEGRIAVYGPKRETLGRYCNTGEKMEVVDLAGTLPRDCDRDMGMISYFDHKGKRFIIEHDGRRHGPPWKPSATLFP